ncbi:MAG: hypothetical protein ACI3YK_07175 [Eubacteriales bacterium]
MIGKKEKMGRILCLMFCTLAVLLLVSCQPNAEEEDESEATTSESSISFVDDTGDLEEIPWGDN